MVITIEMVKKGEEIWEKIEKVSKKIIKSTEKNGEKMKLGVESC
jgi:hypothetical protein